MRLTLLDGARTWRGGATLEDDEVRLDDASLESALGFHREPQGLCRGAVCIPTSSPPDLVTDAGVGLTRLARILGRPLAMSRDAGVASLADAPAEQQARLESLEAPDFELPDLGGRRRRLSDFRGKKILLHAFASW